jgi:hypothetical protein
LPELDPKYAAKAKRAVRAEFPEMAGAKPTVSVRKVHPKGGRGARTLYVLTFRKDVTVPGGGHMKRVVRVTMNQAGGIVKLTSSK